MSNSHQPTQCHPDRIDIEAPEGFVHGGLNDCPGSVHGNVVAVLCHRYGDGYLIVKELSSNSQSFYHLEEWRKEDGYYNRVTSYPFESVEEVRHRLPSIANDFDI